MKHINNEMLLKRTLYYHWLNQKTTDPECVIDKIHDEKVLQSICKKNIFR